MPPETMVRCCPMLLLGNHFWVRGPEAAGAYYHQRPTGLGCLSEHVDGCGLYKTGPTLHLGIMAELTPGT